MRTFLLVDPFATGNTIVCSDIFHNIGEEALLHAFLVIMKNCFGINDRMHALAKKEDFLGIEFRGGRFRILRKFC